MTRRAIVLLIILGTAPLGMTACDLGGGSDGAQATDRTTDQTTGESAGPEATVQTPAFRKAVKDARNAIQRAIDDPRKAGDRRELKAALEQSATRLDTVAARLAQAQAPSKAQGAKDDLADAMDLLAKDLRATADTVQSANLAQVVSHLSTMSAVDDASQAIDDLQVSGVNVTPLRP